MGDVRVNFISFAIQSAGGKFPNRQFGDGKGQSFCRAPADKLCRLENWSWRKPRLIPWAPRFIATEMVNGGGKPEGMKIAASKGGTPLPAQGVGGDTPDGSFQGQPCLWSGLKGQKAPWPDNVRRWKQGF